MTHLTRFLNKDKVLNNLINEAKVIRCGNDESFAFLVYHNYIKTPSPMVIVTENMLACQTLFNKLSIMLKDKVYMYCVDEVTKYSTLATSPELASARLFVLNKLIIA